MTDDDEPTCARSTIDVTSMGTAGALILNAELAKAMARIAELEADVARLRWALDGTTRMMQERSNNQSRGATWMREIVAANQEVLASVELTPAGAGHGED